ncbi:MAG: hypothetical protein MUE42_08525 [Opitutaceae bacterium]|jgi:hypothetical protein|nr:hypothetical protein [Opitutaceae bacterium]
MPARLSALAFLALLALVRPLGADTGPAPQPDRTLSPLLVATNLWYGDPADEVWRQVSDARVRLIRIGGHAYDKNVPSHATLTAWVKKIRAHGAEPVIQVSQYQSPEKAADLVRLFNRRRAAGEPVKIWNIGNEPWLQNGRKAPETVAAEVVAYWKPIAAAMKAVDPTIKLYGFDEAYYIKPAYEALFGGEHDITGRVPGKNYYYCDGLSWHRYPQTTNEPGLAEIEDFHTSMKKIRDLLDRANARHGRRGDDALQWGLGEFNAKGGKQVHTFGTGQMFAAVYGLSARYGATYVASWSMFESGGNRGPTDFGAFDGKAFTPRPSYWHQRLFAETMAGVTVADARSDNRELLVFATHDKKSNRTGLVLLNLSDAAATCDIRFASGGAAPRGTLVSVPLKKQAAHLDKLEPRSSLFLVFEKNRVKRTAYSAEDFAASRAPVATSLSFPNAP